jgi:hypothetical protein
MLFKRKAKQPDGKPCPQCGSKITANVLDCPVCGLDLRESYRPEAEPVHAHSET